MDTKRCPKCERVLPHEAFNKTASRKDGLQSVCRECHKAMRNQEAQLAYNRRYYAEHAEDLRRRALAAYYRDPERKKAYNKARYAADPIRFTAEQAARNLALKRAAFRAYGGPECSCCHEATEAFLSLDHAQNNGGSHRKETGGGSQFYMWLKANNYPTDLGLRVLCFNCNLGRRVNGGVCPHQA